MKKILVLFLLLSAANLSAQQFIPYYKDDSVSVKKYILQSALVIDQRLVPPSNSAKDFKKDLESFKKGHKEDIEGIMRKALLHDTVLCPYVEKVFKQLQEANPSLADQHCFITTDPEVNAFALGEGTVLIHAGMLARMENEAEVAYVLCHEMAHNYLGHMNTKVMSVLALMHDEKFRKDLKKAANSKYNTYQRVEDVLMQFSLKRLYHSRETEVQADSMGMVFLLKAGYSVRDGLRQLVLLDSSDEPLYKNRIDFKSNFTCDEFPYSDEWSAYQLKKAWEAKDSRTQGAKDSLKTHPDCKIRAELLRKYFHSDADVAGPFGKFYSASYEPYRLRAEYEVIQSLYEKKRLDECLYLALQVLAKNPGSDYLHSMVSLSLSEIFRNAKNHTMMDVVEMPDSRFAESYNRLLTLLQNLSLSDLAGLSYCHLKNYKPFDASSEYYIAAKFAGASVKEKKDEMSAAKKSYLGLYPSGKFISLINPTEQSNTKNKKSK